MLSLRAYVRPTPRTCWATRAIRGGTDGISLSRRLVSRGDERVDALAVPTRGRKLMTAITCRFSLAEQKPLCPLQAKLEFAEQMERVRSQCSPRASMRSFNCWHSA